jgi:hypothetical protein
LIWEEDLGELVRLVPVTGPALSDTDDRKEVARRVRLIRSGVVSALRSLVLEDPAWARFWLRNALLQVGPEGSHEDHYMVLLLQEVYACLLTLGPVDLSQRAAQAPTVPWVARLTLLAAKTVDLSAMVRELGQDTIAGVTVRAGVLRIAPSDAWTWIAEVNLNRSTGWGHHREDLSDSVDDVERQVYGASAVDLLVGLLADLAKASGGSSTDIPGVLVVAMSGPDERTQLRRRHLVLTRDNWRSSSVPSFMFADQRPGSWTDQSLVVNAAEADWLACAPLLQGQRASSPVAFTTSALVHRALTRAVSAQSVRLHLATETAKVGAPATAAAVRRRASEVHSGFEAAAAAECFKAGLFALTGVESLAGRRLACGEIDVLAGGQGVDRPVILLGECKNLDFTFFKDTGPTQTKEVIRRGSDQVARKRAWVAENWRTLSTTLHIPEIEPEIVGVVVTRTIAAPALAHGVPVVPLAELADVAATLVGIRADGWRGDVRAARTSAKA